MSAETADELAFSARHWMRSDAPSWAWDAIDRLEARAVELVAFKQARDAAERALPRKAQQLDAIHKAASDALTWWENYGLFDPDDDTYRATLDVLRAALSSGDATRPTGDRQ